MSSVFSPTGVMSFEEFVAWKPDHRAYELYEGIPFEMQPVGQHEEIVGYLTVKIAVEIARSDLPYFLPKQALIKPPSRASGMTPLIESAYCADVMAIKRAELSSEPLWSSSSTLTRGDSLALVVEVVSTNWRTDYGYKLTDYEALGILEYWIVDYVPLGGRRAIGDPRLPTVSIYRLLDNEFSLEQFRGDELIVSGIFPDINLTADQIFTANSK
ncbi:MAG: Uma2 family endonuclease [Gemmatimonadaceae bacterium]|nr:Uma2 family endonuclease [Gloeobacterales cyanobacterium ES-bin-141]